ncbi:hypothetical protein Shell_1166 [Staphylothermus hellenicus DSM 12710]|uniref:Uncharacterized protein n=2 Tax=Staphylothermus hellenicus TaxID=84599 RepID=D7D920_STAHD|nr:hypothetical protein Shell_1166 [Staphylothermus hellenicus DSM 12710]
MGETTANYEEKQLRDGSMPIPQELIDLLKERELEVKKRKGRIIAAHSELPVSLIVRLSGSTAIIELEAGEELEDVMSDLVESGEDLESIVEDVLSEMRDIAVDVSRLLSDKGFKVELRLREGENDVRDAMEEIIEEYAESEEE